ncbi:type II secretion system protein GspL [Spartinivicinus poritis]|uniref:Type II secretion system protein L n=1 Tax=Spartinivicinus poritis TaxID=2994640 RepID=A0ABT5UF47_9GAMM|nr:type II secretion system protein GspL [Spartinivicinus sp. A2-2]MDE1465004.1 type II secretion system protein GspL [Spartinivicinus sp. A2-2]
MEGYLFIRVTDVSGSEPDQISAEWLGCNSEGELHFGPSRGQLTALEQTLAEQEGINKVKVVVVVPADHVLMLNVPVNAGQMKHLKQALPFMLEEYLINDIDDMHIVTNRQVANEMLPVAAVNHEYIAPLYEAIHAIGLVPMLCISESQLVTTKDDTIQAIIDGDRSLLAIPPNCFFGLDMHALPSTLMTVLENPSEYRQIDVEDDPSAAIAAEFKQIKVTVAKPLTTEVKKLLKQLETQLASHQISLEYSALKGTIFHYLCRSFLQRTDYSAFINLFQDPYGVSSENTGLGVWKPLVGLVAGWLVLAVGLNVGQGVYFDLQTNNLKQQSISLYQDVYPNDDAEEELQERMVSRLKAAGGGKQESPFMDMLVNVSSVTQQLGGQQIKPKSLDFNQSAGSLTIEVHAKSYEILDNYVQKLKGSGLSANLETANQEKASVLARISIKV